MKQVTNLNELEASVTQNGEMVVTINNGKLMAMKEKEYYDQKMKEEIGRNLMIAEEDIKNGRYRNAREVFKEWKEKYGI